MMKKYQKIIIAICFFCILGFCFLRVIQRGSVYITIDNQTADELTVAKVNDQMVDKTMDAHTHIKVRYRISADGGIMLSLNQNGIVTEKEIVSYVSSGYYGKVCVTVRNVQDNGLDIEVKEHVHV